MGYAYSVLLICFAIKCSRFSPDNKFLAVGSHEGCLDFYNLSKGPSLQRAGFCKGINGFVAMVDFATNSSYVRVSLTSFQLQYIRHLTRVCGALF